MKRPLITTIVHAGHWISDHSLRGKPVAALMVAVACMLVALGIRLAVAPIEAGLQYLTFFPAVTLAAFLGGFRAGILATIIGMFLGSYIFIPPYWEISLAFSFDNLWSNIIFLIDGLLLSLIIETSHSYRKQYQAELAESQLSWGKLQDLILQREVDYNLLLKLESIIQSTDDAVISLSLDGIIQSWNPGATNLFGYKAHEVIGNSIILMVPPERTREEIDILTRIEQGKHIEQFETVSSCKDGRQTDIASTISPIFNSEGQVIGVSMISRDISQRKQAEAQQAKITSELADFKAALDQHAIVAITDTRGVITYVNDKFCAISKYSREELLGSNHSIINSGHHSTEFFIELWKTIHSGKIWNGEIRNLAKDNTFYWLNSTIVPILDAQGKPVQFITIRTDITERKQLEQSLIATRDEAERANKAKDAFLATMSHEIRTPLGGMLGMLELLSLTNLDADQLSTLDMASTSGAGLLRILNDILDWSKIQEGKLEIIPAPFLLEAMLREVANTYSGIANSKSLRIMEHIDPQLLAPYCADSLRLSQVLNNFVSNALKFTESGEIEIRAELVESFASGDLVRFSVKDTGIGISKDVQENLFQHYSQGNADTARMYGGTGLGLAICRRLAEMQGGEISLISKPGQGSTFSFTLTLPRYDAAMEISFTHQPDITQHTYQPLFTEGIDAPLVLVVDDHPTNRELLTRQLKILGLRAITAENGRIGLALWRKERFAMIITDCHMPDMDGYELTREIREIETDENRSRIPIIAWTANALKEEHERIEIAGMDELLLKPVNMQALRRVLIKWLGTGNNDSKSFEAGLSNPEIVSLSTTPAPIDFSVLNAIMSSKAEQSQLLRDFLAHIRTDRCTLDELLAQDDIAAVQRTAHRMRGSSNMVGALRLGSACASIEHAAKRNSSLTVRAATMELDEAIHEMDKFVG